MSESSMNQATQDAEFWEFVACTKCYLPYSSEENPTIPFWLTECGHVLCNAHLSPDQSCTCCGTTNIQVVPLQQQLDSPMCDWFQAAPVTLDNIANALKFQQEMLYGQIRYYRTKMQQYKGYVERLKHDSAQLRKINDTLSKDNEYLKQSRASTSQTRARHHYDNHNQEPASFQNGNNKRPMMQTFSQYPQDQDLYLSSSPRSIVTPIGPNRITLPAGHQAPTLSAEKQRHPDQYRQQHSMTASVPGPQSRPGSSRQLQQYAYAPPETSQFKSPALTKTQAAPKYFQRTSTQSNTMANTSAQSSGTWVTRQEPGRQEGQTPSTRQTPQFNHSAPGPPGSKAAQPMQKQVMGPPPTPQRLGTRHNPLASNANQAAGKPSAGLSTSANRRFVPRPGNIQSGANKQQVQGQQFSRTPMPGLSGSGQRQPFLPSGSN